MVASSVTKEVEELEISPWNDFEYNLDYDVDFYEELFYESDLLADGIFKKNKWLLNNSYNDTYTHLDFSEILELSCKYKLPFELLTLTKCWVVTHMEQNLSTSQIQMYLRNWCRFLKWSRGINPKYKDDFISDVEFFFLEKEARSQTSFCGSILNFIDFFPSSVHPSYITTIQKLKKKSGESNVRVLPAFSDVATFDNILNDYFSNCNPLSLDYIRYFPLFLWWNFTPIIPSRPVEICRIKRDALIPDGKNYYLKLPREKQKGNSKRIQVVDTIKIPFELGRKIEEYIEITDTYGPTETLFSFRAHSVHPLHLSFKKKINPNRFSSINLIVLLESFYYHIVQNQYGVFVSDFGYHYKKAGLPQNFEFKGTVERRIRPGDTRHFAIMNLLRQDYHIFEIARLAGHTSLRAQNPYQQHEEVYYDFELLKIANFFRGNIKEENKEKNKALEQRVRDNVFRNEKIEIEPNKHKYQDKLDVGYCIDELKRCPTQFSTTHIHCPYWKISLEEFKETEGLIASELEGIKKNVSRLLNSLFNLHSVALKEYSNSDDYLEDNVINRSKIKKINRNITSELKRVRIAEQNLLKSGVGYYGEKSSGPR
ncbi:site-specific integrase [Mesobacillus foraminis]|uniref:site-specific integrase n=1 Tax=Mesobacillus foraminis TaxID=279826 RepID=UPI000EF55073|nr:site-specific integrase [Mesobacillus foraminis]